MIIATVRSARDTELRMSNHASRKNTGVVSSANVWAAREPRQNARPQPASPTTSRQSRPTQVSE